MVQLQFLLELFMDASISNIFVNIFLVVSLIIGNNVLINRDLSRIELCFSQYAIWNA